MHHIITPEIIFAFVALIIPIVFSLVFLNPKHPDRLDRAMAWWYKVTGPTPKKKRY